MALRADRKVIIIKGTTEQDIYIVLPDGRQVTVQYRNYEGDTATGSGGTLDVVLPEIMAVTNWEGSDMKPAARVNRQDHVRDADQIMVVL